MGEGDFYWGVKSLFVLVFDYVASGTLESVDNLKEGRSDYYQQVLKLYKRRFTDCIWLAPDKFSEGSDMAACMYCYAYEDKADVSAEVWEEL